MIDLFSVYVGSRAFNIHTIDSDFDLRGVSLLTVADRSDPYAPRYNGKRENDAYWYEWSHFLSLLAKQDTNAWITLMSNQVEHGSVKQMAIRQAAIQHLLDSNHLFERAKKMMHELVDEGIRSDNNKLVSHGLKIGVFGVNMSHVLPSGCFLREFEDRIYRIKYAKKYYLDVNLEEARLLINEIEAGHVLNRHVPSSQREARHAFTKLYCEFTKDLLY